MPLRPWPDGSAAGACFTVLAGLFALSGCASSSKPPPPPSSTGGTPEQVTTVRHVDMVTPVAAPTLVGKRCAAGNATATGCKCRTPDDPAEDPPPGEGQKRLEIRMSVHGGEGVLQAPTVGRFTATGAADTCFYVDVPAGSKAAWTYVARASNPDAGLAPRLTIFEYGPKGPFWYEIFAFDCVGVGGKCDGAGVAAWNGRLKTRQRGRMDPCGSLVVTGLDWETSGGLAHRDTGLYRDFSVRFDAEVKKFATQFPPHATECIPK
jgi:hypothetical protein